MRDLEFRDAFTVARLIKKTKIKDTLPEIIRKGKEDGTSVEGIGVDAFLCILEGAGEEGVENEVAKFLADVTEQDAETYKKKKLTDVINDVKAFFKSEGFSDFLSSLKELTK